MLSEILPAHGGARTPDAIAHAERAKLSAEDQSAHGGIGDAEIIRRFLEGDDSRVVFCALVEYVHHALPRLSQDVLRLPQ